MTKINEAAVRSAARVTLAKVKTMRGIEGPAYSCDLVFDGKVVAHVIESGYGGPLHFEWKKPSVEKQVAEAVQPLMVERAEAEEASTPVDANGRKPNGVPAGFWPGELKKSAMTALESWIPMTIDHAETIKKLRRYAQKHVLLRNPDARPGSYFTIKVPPTPANIADIAAQPINKGFVVLNNLPESRWLETLGIW